MPQSDLISAAYDLVAHIPEAVGSARILAEMFPAKDVMCGLLLSFSDVRGEDLDAFTRQIAAKLPASDDLSFILSIVSAVRAYDTDVMPPKKWWQQPIKRNLLEDARMLAIDVCIQAITLWRIENVLFSQDQQGALREEFEKSGAKGVAIGAFNNDSWLRSARRDIETIFLPAAIGYSVPAVEARVYQTLRTLDAAIAKLPHDSRYPQPGTPYRPSLK